MRLWSFLSIIALLFSGCSTRGAKAYHPKNTILQLKPIIETQTPTNIQTNSNYKSKVLYEEYEKWKGTPYKLGGESLHGVDCSSFIQQVYYDAFRLKIPRTTSRQVNVGYAITKKQLRVGDMIFFKTGWNVKHVGIIIEDGKFIHASTSKGVMISSIHNPYWKDNYYLSRRVLP